MDFVWSATPAFALDFLLFPESLNPLIEIPTDINDSTSFSYTLTVTQAPDCVARATVTINVAIGTDLSQDDCVDALRLCLEDVFIEPNFGMGGFDDFVNENNVDGCLSGEHFSAWYFFEFSEDTPSDADLEMILQPDNPNADLDFAIWGPNVTCDSLGAPIRCSFAGGSGQNTGMIDGIGHETEGSAGDGFVEDLVVNSGEKYYLLIDIFGNEASGINILWKGTASTFMLCDSTLICDLAVSIEPQNVLCSGDSTGLIVASPNGGTPPYSFLWSNGATTADISTLIAGTYGLTLTDANACSIEQDVLLAEPDVLSLSIENSNDASSPNANDGSFTIIINGGTLPYLFEGDTIMGNTVSLNNLAPGTYPFSLMDANGCVATTSVNIGFSFPLQITSLIPNYPTCEGAMDGSISLNVEGGVPPYAFNWDNGAANVQNPQNLGTGTYHVTVTDAEGAMVFSSVTLLASKVIQVRVLRTRPVTCFNGNTGSIEVAVSGGSAPYQFNWGEGLGNTPKIVHLMPGQYQVTVTDANGCTGVSEVVNLSNPTPLVAIGSSTPDTGSGNGTASVSVTGGVLPYTYYWLDLNNQNTPTVTDLTAGIYNVYIEDRYGCFAFISVAVDGFQLKNNLLPVEALVIGPNPSDGHFNVQLTLERAAAVELNILDVSGRNVFHLSAAESSFHHFAVNLREQVAGLYVVNISTGQQLISQKVIIQ